MSLLGFLRIIKAIRPSRASSAPRRGRRMELETLERRSVLALVDSLAADLEPVEPIATFEQSLPLVEPLSDAAQDVIQFDTGGAGSGTGEPDPLDPPIVTSDQPILTNGGSGSGTGDPGPESPPSSSSGSGTGEGGEAPIITSLDSDRMGLWVSFVGAVTDADGPVEGLTVYFMVGESSEVAFTTVVGADGTFSSMLEPIDVGVLIRAYTIDADGNQSLITSCYA